MAVVMVLSKKEKKDSMHSIPSQGLKRGPLT